MTKVPPVQVVALVLVATAGLAHGDTMSLDFQNKPVAWVERSMCGDFVVRGRIMLCGKTVQESITLLRDEFRPMGGMTVWEYAVNRFRSMQAFSIRDIISENTLLPEIPREPARRCSSTCCCAAPAETAWLIDTTFTEEEEAKLFKTYLEESLVYYLTYLNGICARPFLDIEPQPCAKWSAKVGTVVCDTTVADFVSQVALGQAFGNNLRMLEFLQCQYPSMTNPSTYLDLVAGIQEVPIGWNHDGCQCSNPVGWELTATFTEQNEAESFLEFMNGTFPATLATQYGQCSSVFPQGVLPTESLYTAQVTTRMCVSDDANLIESSSSSQTVGDPGEFQYIIKALQDTYTPIDDVTIFEYMMIHFPSLMFPVSPDQLANEYNIVATEIPFWCMDKLSTCCCTHPVEWKVTAKFSEKRDADYFLQYMSKTVPAYLSIVHKVCTVNEYKGLFEFQCDCDQAPPTVNRNCPI